MYNLALEYAQKKIRAPMLKPGDVVYFNSLFLDYGKVVDISERQNRGMCAHFTFQWRYGHKTYFWIEVNQIQWSPNTHRWFTNYTGE